MHVIGLFDVFTHWWDSLNGARQLFYGIGLAAGFCAIILAVLAFLGMEHHEGLEGATSLDTDAGGIFSIKPLTGFFLGFGWIGGIALDFGFSLLVAVVAACVAGTLVTAVIVVMFRTIYAMRSDGTMQVNDALGATGTVYITVPPGKNSGGQVTVNFRGRQETFAALTESAHLIASGDKIKVTRIIDGQTVLVEPI